MANTSLVKKTFAFSPHIEMLFRRIYWANVNVLSKRVKIKKASSQDTQSIDYSKIEEFLRDQGVNEGKLVVVHSAYAPFKGRGKTPNQLLDYLFNIIGSTGTLAMPAMPKFKNSANVEDYLQTNCTDAVFEYDVVNSPIKTGVLPMMLHKRQYSVRSRHPINSLVAEGPLAKTMMDKNLEGDSPLACGNNSSWKFCADNDAIIVGFGVDLTHSLTMIHVAEDVLDEDWPINNWYLNKTFIIKDHEFNKEVTLRERAPKWGALHFAERTLCKDLIKKGILQSKVIDGVTIEVLNAKRMLDFLHSKNATGYPYFWL